MKRTLTGTRLLVTGASGGIGRAVAEQAVRGGARVALMARTAHQLDDLVRSLAGLPGEALAVAGDVTVEGDRRRALDAVARRFGGLDVLINNAAIASFGHFATSTEDILRQVMETNFFAPAELIRSAIPLLECGRQPAVVNVSSVCGRRGMPAWPEYSGSKFALCGLTEALRGELTRFGIDVLLVVPGRTKNSLGRRMLRHEGRMKRDYTEGMPAEQVARGILKALCGNRRETVLGWDARWILRANRWMPRLVDWLIGRTVRRLYEQN